MGNGCIHSEECQTVGSKLGFGAAAQTDGDAAFSAQWTGLLRPRFTGRHEIEILHSNPEVWLEIDGASLVSETTPRQTEMLFMILPLNRRRVSVELEAGRDTPIRIRYAQPSRGSIRAFNIFEVKLREPAPDRAAAIRPWAALGVVIWSCAPRANSTGQVMRAIAASPPV